MPAFMSASHLRWGVAGTRLPRDPPHFAAALLLSSASMPSIAAEEAQRVQCAAHKWLDQAKNLT